MNDNLQTANHASTNPVSKTAVPGITTVVLIMCWFTMLSEGYDLGIYGAVLPALMEDKSWALSAATAGAIGSYALIGMLIGAVFVGTISDIIGRKKTLIFCLTTFSILMAFAASASSPEMFGLFRFLGGLVLGGVIPTVSALTIEYSPVKSRSLMYAIMYSGYPAGGVIGALLSINFLQEHGWRLMFWVGVLPILVVPFLIKFLPESIGFLIAKNRRQDAENIAKKYDISLDSIEGYNAAKKDDSNKLAAIVSLFKGKSLIATIFFWLTFFMGLLMIYGLNTWLPKMMKTAGYPLGSSLSFLLMLNFSAVVGALIGGKAADRFGSKKVISISYFLAGISIALLSIKSSMPVVYALVGIAGFGTIGTTLICNAYISKYFGAENRATALGWALGFGRIGAIIGPLLGGMFMTWKLDLSWNFYAFAMAGVIASITILFIPKHSQGNV